MNVVQLHPVESQSPVGPEGLEALSKIVAEIKESGHLYQATFNELYEVGVIQNRWIPQLRTRLLVIAEQAEKFLRKHRCGISGPYDGLDEMGGAYYLIDLLHRPPMWPYRVLVTMPKEEFGPAERKYAAWLESRGKTYRIDPLLEHGLVEVSVKDRSTGKSFVRVHGGTMLTNRQSGDLLYGPKQELDPEFIERSWRREACATSTATPAT